MKNVTYILIAALSVLHTQVMAQRSCGIEAEKANMIARDPSWAQRFEAQRASLQSIADNYKLQKKLEAADRTTGTISPVPVIFHIIITSADLANMGGTAGILQRIDSQIVVLNRDYNKQNSDSTLIPSGWKSLYASVGVHFGLAHTAPDGYGTPGYELKIIGTDNFTSGTYGDYSDAKNAATGGLTAWDNTKYMNVWCINFSDEPGLLGITCPLSFTSPGGQPVGDVGICINYLALGAQTSPASLNFPTGGDYAAGRTLTHEVGHMFEIWHTWGDDAGLCPWTTPYPGCGNNGDGPTEGTGNDDGLGDTPPEGDHQYGNPSYTIVGGTYNDCCQYNLSSTNVQPIGICSQCFINYTDDDAMHMFTTDQANAMAAMVLETPSSVIGATGSGTVGESYSLTQNPGLLNWPPKTGIVPVGIGNSLNIFPNPTTGIVNITFDATSDQLQHVTVTNIVGQEVESINISGTQTGYYSLDLSGLSKGVYFVKCNFASESVTRKILLQ